MFTDTLTIKIINFKVNVFSDEKGIIQTIYLRSGLTLHNHNVV